MKWSSSTTVCILDMDCWWVVVRVSECVRGKKKKCWLFRRPHSICQVIIKKVTSKRTNNIWRKTCARAELLSLTSTSTSIQQVDDCKLFAVDAMLFAAFISFILTEHFSIVPENETDFYRYVRGMCVRSCGCRPITCGNIPLCGQIAWSRLWDRAAWKTRRFVQWRSNFNCQIHCYLAVASHSRTRCCTCRSSSTSICPFKRSIHLFICLFHY